MSNILSNARSTLPNTVYSAGRTTGVSRFTSGTIPFSSPFNPNSTPGGAARFPRITTTGLKTLRNQLSTNWLVALVPRAEIARLAQRSHR